MRALRALLLIAVPLSAGADLVESPLPPKRPLQGGEPVPGSEFVLAERDPAPFAAPEPPSRKPPEIEPQAPAAAAPETPPLAGAGPFCRDPRLVGSVKATFIDEKNPNCGVLEPVEITSAAGVRFSTSAMIDCTTARAVADWLMGVVQPAARDLYQSRVTEIRVVGSYVCRTRNHQAGAKISEHGKGRAIDIAAFRLADGRWITVRSGWRDKQAGPFLRRLWEGACGAFGTVLGPESDRFHQDHFHFDTARHRGGSYCR